MKICCAAFVVVNHQSVLAVMGLWVAVANGRRRSTDVSCGVNLGGVAAEGEGAVDGGSRLVLFLGYG